MALPTASGNKTTSPPTPCTPICRRISFPARCSCRPASGRSFARRTPDVRSCRGRNEVANRDAAVDAGELERLAESAYLFGHERESTDAWTRAHQLYLERGDVQSAARCAFWLGFSANAIGDLARGSGWLARGRRLVQDLGHDCAERIYLSFPEGVRLGIAKEHEASYAIFAEMTAAGTRLNDKTLVAIGRLGEGRCLMHMGRPAEGLALLDEVLVSVTLGEASPLMVGTLYCSALDACHEMFDLRRAHEWTSALTKWCEAEPA